GMSEVPDGSSRPRNMLRLNPLSLVVGIALVPASVTAQGYPFSQRGSVSQTVAFTTISVTYGRPIARGRALFGQLVPWDSVWHPGAASATGFVSDPAVPREGHRVKAGEFSLWLLPRERAAWTVILSRAAHTFHKPYPVPKMTRCGLMWRQSRAPTWK